MNGDHGLTEYYRNFVYAIALSGLQALVINGSELARYQIYGRYPQRGAPDVLEREIREDLEFFEALGWKTKVIAYCNSKLEKKGLSFDYGKY